MLGSSTLLRRTILALAGASLLACFVCARPAAVWQPVGAIRTATLTAVADFNQDGSPDHVTSDRSVVSINLSRQRSSTVQLTHATPVVGLLAADVDHDGDTDVLALTRAGRIWIWRNDGGGDFSAQIVVPRRLSNRRLPPGLELAHGGFFEEPGESPRCRHQLTSPPGSAAMAVPTGAESECNGFAPSARRARNSRPSSPRAPPIRLAA